MNIQQLRTIFESSGSARRLHLPQEYMALAKYIESDMIQIELRRLEAVPQGIQEQLNRVLETQRWDETTLARAIPRLAAISNGGGRTHTIMCRCGAAWLIDQGYDILAEQRFNGCRVDLLSTCRTWIIEGGDTSPSPLPHHLARGVQQIGIIPFQHNQPPHMEMFIFSKGTAWNHSSISNDLIVDFAG